MVTAKVPPGSCCKKHALPLADALQVQVLQTDRVPWRKDLPLNQTVCGSEKGVLIRHGLLTRTGQV